MEQAGPKPETIKLVSPNGTKFRWSYYVTPDEYKGVRKWKGELLIPCLLYTSPSPRDGLLSRMPSSA